MNIILCLDYSSFTERVLEAVTSFTSSVKDVKMTVFHVIDERMFYATTGYEVQLGEDLHSESNELKELCIKYFGVGVNYVEEFGIPVLKIGEMMEETAHDLLIVGSHSRHGLGDRLLGSTAEQVLRESNKPVLIIP